MKLIASLIVKDEADRYLGACLEHLLTYVDEVRIVDDGSSDAFRDMNGFVPGEGVQVLRMPTSSFYEHEGQARQRLLDWTMEGKPTHILAIDADEFVADGQAVRDAAAGTSTYGIWTLTMQEVWDADDDQLLIRQDGGWKEHPIGILYEVLPDHYTNRQIRRHWHIAPRALACGRVPVWIGVRANRTRTTPVSDILHFGWTNTADRQERYDRYAVHDGGAHHAGSHLDSIMWGDDRITTSSRPWPSGLASVKQRLVKRAGRA